MVKMQSHFWQSPLRLAGLISILSCAHVTRAAEPPKIAPGAGHDLFAPDLSDADYPAGIWSWSNGELSSHEQDEAIWTKGEYENFLLDFEFRLEPAANSGVFLYTTNTADWMKNHVEIQLLDDAAPKWTNVPPNWKCAGLFGHASPTNAAVKASRGMESHDHSQQRRSPGNSMAQWRTGAGREFEKFDCAKTIPTARRSPNGFRSHWRNCPARGALDFKAPMAAFPRIFGI